MNVSKTYMPRNYKQFQLSERYTTKGFQFYIWGDSLFIQHDTKFFELRPVNTYYNLISGDSKKLMVSFLNIDHFRVDFDAIMKVVCRSLPGVEI